MMEQQPTRTPIASEPAGSSDLPSGKKAGVGMHFTSLASPYGIGDIGASALAFVDLLASMKITYWQFLPTGPTAYGDSPYQPLSAFAGNEMLIGIEPLIQLGLLSDEEAGVLTGLSDEYVDYGQLIPKKQALLKLAAERFSSSAGDDAKMAYEAFLVLHDSRWLNDYALYRILKTRHAKRPWPEWDEVFAGRDPVHIKALQKSATSELEQVKIMQFLFDQQWQTLKRYAHQRSVYLFGDMPIYIALDSADAWAHPEILLIDQQGRPSYVAGVPPDYFSADGQLWGNPLYDWKFHQANGYQWWIERIQYAANQADLVRIDHFRGFESFWAVKFGAQTAREGEWLAGPMDGLFDAIRKKLGALPIVAEDLGVITAEVDGLRERHHIPGMKVLQFLVDDPDFNPADIGRNRVCYTGTHDNDTTLGWFNGGSDETRSEHEISTTRANALRLTAGKPETIHWDMIRMAFGTEARLAIAPMQDFLGLGSDSRLNTPGTTSHNWRWRVNSEQMSDGFCEEVSRLVEETSRN
jgi:4-alpha-glucanotransferase